jgi:hypothetical protein
MIVASAAQESSRSGQPVDIAHFLDSQNLAVDFEPS